MPKQNQTQQVEIAKTPTAFISNRLDVTDMPEYSHFPLNVLFGSFRNADGRLRSGSALYEPDFHTYGKQGHVSSMRYNNIYGGECYLVIGYDEKNRRYYGEKFINGKSVSLTDGSDNWELFFTHFTMHGLAAGEKCKFEYMEAP